MIIQIETQKLKELITEAVAEGNKIKALESCKPDRAVKKVTARDRILKYKIQLAKKDIKRKLL